ncbi:hypothetical protein HZA75_03080 [Candidatus Roizmanbacteria bacterium]|nr:hypothetical protein [Candidatus Roizmanbacteria bacterium]
MALEASHIRFALDIKDKLEVKDIKKYVSGVIYPDSRYVTKIDRHLTHPLELLESDFLQLDDFRKGCYAHILYDKIWSGYTLKTLYEFFLDAEDSQIQGNELWIRLTTLKILQDIEDAKSYDIERYLPYLDYVENINGEDSNALLKYNKYFQEMYSEPQKLSIENYSKMWNFLGLKVNIGAKLKSQVDIYKNNLEIKKFINIAYIQTLAVAVELNK